MGQRKAPRPAPKGMVKPNPPPEPSAKCYPQDLMHVVKRIEDLEVTVRDLNTRLGKAVAYMGKGFDAIVKLLDGAMDAENRLEYLESKENLTQDEVLELVKLRRSQ